MFFSTAAAQTAAAPAAGPSLITSLIPFLLMGLVFYFLLIRPQQQARKKHLEMVQSVRRGDEVVTAGGLLGKITKAGDGDECQVQIADGVVVTVVKSTLTTVRGKDPMAKPANDAAVKPAKKTKS